MKHDFKRELLKNLAEANGISPKLTSAKIEQRLIDAEVLSPRTVVESAQEGDTLLWAGGAYDFYYADFDEIQHTVDRNVYVKVDECANLSKRTMWVKAPYNVVEVSLDDLFIDVKARATTIDRRFKLWLRDIKEQNKAMLKSLEDIDNRASFAALFITGKFKQRLPEYKDGQFSKLFDTANDKKKRFTKCDWDLNCPDVSTLNPFRTVGNIYQYTGTLSVFICRSVRRMIANAKRKYGRDDEIIGEAVKHDMLVKFFEMLHADVDAYALKTPVTDDFQEVAVEAAANLVVNELSAIKDEHFREVARINRERELAEINERISSLCRALVERNILPGDRVIQQYFDRQQFLRGITLGDIKDFMEETWG